MKRICALLLMLLVLLVPLTARPVVALVLSGGGARGLIHVPIIKELEKRGIYPDIVTGTSMGGLVGGLYAAGYTSEELYEFVLNQNLAEVVFSIVMPVYPETDMAYDPYDQNILSLSYGSEGIGASNSVLDDTKINTMLRSLIVKTADVENFDELTIPFRTIGTDLRTGEEVIFSSGSLYDALRSTMSMPVFFPPYVTEDGRYMVDGGVVNNFPVEVARAMGADIIIAVDVNEDVRAHAGSSDSLDTLSGVFQQYLTLSGQNAVYKQYSDVDFLIIPNTGEIGVTDFASAPRILEMGEEYVASHTELFDSIEEALSEYLPMEQPDNLYHDREYSYVQSISIPERLDKYEELIREYEGREYTEDYISEFDDLLENLRYRENLRSIGYNYSDGVITLFTQDYIRLQSVFFTGFTGGINYNFLPGSGNGLTFDMALSLSTRIRYHQIVYDMAIKFGQQNTVSADLSMPVHDNIYWNMSIGGGFGGFSVISSRFLVNRYVTRDWNFNARSGIYWTPSGNHRLDAGIRGDIYLLGAGTEGSIWQLDRHFIGSAYGLYHYNDLNENIFFAQYHNELEVELDVGYARRHGFAWSIAADYNGFYRLAQNHYLDYSAAVFSSRYPYELASAYHISKFGVLSRDYAYGDLFWRYNLNNVYDGLYTGVGLFVAGDSGLKLDNSSTGGVFQLVYNDGSVYDSSLIPFTSIRRFSLGFGAKVGLHSEFGTAEFAVSVTYRGEVAVSLRVI